MSAKTNILKALINLKKVKNNNINEMYMGKNRINNVGKGLEYYIKDLFCESYDLRETQDKERQHQKYLSYLGNQNNPPDFIIENFDAVEVKKIQSQGSSIALNSSPPKEKLFKDDPRITSKCRGCEEEDWEEKDIIYVIGVVKKGELKLLWFVYGDCYAANIETYKNIYYRLKEALISSGPSFSETKELGRINDVDPMGITYLRARGIWHISNPLKVFDYLESFDKENDLTVYAIMKEEKYNNLPIEDRNKAEGEFGDNSENYGITTKEIKDPNNPANNINAKFIRLIFNDI